MEEISETKSAGNAKTAAKNTVSHCFTKQQLTSSARYAPHRDLLNALLEDDKTYSYKEVDSAIDEFHRKGGV